MAGLSNVCGTTDGLDSAARFGVPLGTAVDSQGNIYVADKGNGQINSTIRMISTAGTVGTLAGLADNPGSADGIGSAARFATPFSVAVDGAGNVYVADTGNHTIRKIRLARWSRRWPAWRAASGMSTEREARPASTFRRPLLSMQRAMSSSPTAKTQSFAKLLPPAW